jgi:hypothetical protein
MFFKLCMYYRRLPTYVCNLLCQVETKADLKVNDIHWPFYKKEKQSTREDEARGRIILRNGGVIGVVGPHSIQ